jgi:hypothetical protein
MLADLIDALGRNIAELAYVFLVVVLVATTVHADKRYSQERSRTDALERRVRSLVLVVRFQDAALTAKLTPATPVTDEPEVLDLSVDAMISQLGYCLTCHRLKAPVHFTQTDHLQLEDEDLVQRNERH